MSWSSSDFYGEKNSKDATKSSSPDAHLSGTSSQSLGLENPSPPESLRSTSKVHTCDGHSHDVSPDRSSLDDLENDLFEGSPFELFDPKCPSISRTESPVAKHPIRPKSCPAVIRRRNVTPNFQPERYSQPILLISRSALGRRTPDDCNVQEMKIAPSYKLKEPRTPLEVIISKKEKSKFGKRPLGHKFSATRAPVQRPLGYYSRSLKMIGVKLPDPPQTNRNADRMGSSRSWSGTEGRLHTRLTRRFTSLENVSTAIPEIKTPSPSLRSLTLETHQREILSQAIYEEWYFSKKKKIRETKAKKMEKIRIEQMKKDHEKKVQENQIKIAMEGWKEKKEKEISENKVKRKVEEKEKREKSKQEKAEKEEGGRLAFESWKIEKREKKREKTADEKAREERNKAREAEKHNKRTEAEKVYASWLHEKKNKEMEGKIKAIEMVEALERQSRMEKEERRAEVDAIYREWKKKKANEEREKEVEFALKGESDRRLRQKTENKRSSLAQAAYESWLDDVENRRPRQVIDETRLMLMTSSRRPWCPGGSKNSLLDC